MKHYVYVPPIERNPTVTAMTLATINAVWIAGILSLLFVMLGVGFLSVPVGLFLGAYIAHKTGKKLWRIS